jgi:hypothetical protein
MKALLKIVALAPLLTGLASAQQIPDGSARSGYLSVMSKAGTPVPRPSVPVRYVPLPAGAAAGYDYYYGYRYRGGAGAPSPSYANQPAPSTSSSLPGYDTRPRSSHSKNKKGQRF